MPQTLIDSLGFQSKRLVAYGAGVALLQMRAVTELSLEYAVDDTPGLAGTSIDAVPIFPSARLNNERRDDLLVVIFANVPATILAIAESLNAMGFVWGENYIDCSLLHFASMAPRLSALGLQPSRDLFSRVRLLSLYSAVPNMSYIAGTWLFVELLRSLGSDGPVAECGVYNGGNALISLLCGEGVAGRHYHLLDSFQGFRELSPADPASRRAEFRDVKFATVHDIFNNFPNVRIHKGYFSETLPALAEDRYAMVYMDCDLYEPTLELCEYFYPRMSTGGCLLWHDYWVPEQDPPHVKPFRGVHRAVREFLGSEIEHLMVFPETTHALLIR
jgi:Macrocin-O-methyltransferase (TylF)